MSYATTPGRLTDLFLPLLKPDELLQGIFLCRERLGSGADDVMAGLASSLRTYFGLRRYYYFAITDQRLLVMRVNRWRGLAPGKLTEYPRQSVHCKRCDVRMGFYTLVELKIDGKPGLWKLTAPAGGAKTELWGTLK